MGSADRELAALVGWTWVYATKARGWSGWSGEGADDRGGAAGDDRGDERPDEVSGVLVGAAVALVVGVRELGGADQHTGHAEREHAPGGPLQDGEQLARAGRRDALAGIRHGEH